MTGGGTAEPALGGFAAAGRNRGGRARDRGGHADATMATARDGRARGLGLPGTSAPGRLARGLATTSSAVVGMPRF